MYIVDHWKLQHFAVLPKYKNSKSDHPKTLHRVFKEELYTQHSVKFIIWFRKKKKINISGKSQLLTTAWTVCYVPAAYKLTYLLYGGPAAAMWPRHLNQTHHYYYYYISCDSTLVACEDRGKLPPVERSTHHMWLIHWHTDTLRL